jgi:membrane fusion protein (multidrug efflux system)
MLRSRTVPPALLLPGCTALLVAAVLLDGCRDARTADAKSASPPATSPATAPVAPSAPGRPTAEVRRETLRRCAPAVGSFRARQTTKLGPQVSGRVQQVLVDVGDLVKEGQVLVRLDPTFFEIDVQQNKAAVAACEGALASLAVDVADAEREMNRQLDLFEQGAGSTKERDDAVTAYDRAVANRAEKAGRLAEAQKRLEYAQQQLEETQIRAPYDGAITARMVDPGESATMMPPTQLVAIQEVGVLYLEFALPQELLGSVSAGAPLQFEVEGVPDGAATGTVAVIFPAMDEMTRSFYCRAVIENPRRKYQPGLLARVNVVLQEVKDALVVPRTALSQTASGWQALVAAEDGPPVVTPVEVGLMTDDWAQVLKGLTEGDRVIAAANGRS